MPCVSHVVTGLLLCFALEVQLLVLAPSIYINKLLALPFCTMDNYNKRLNCSLLQRETRPGQSWPHRMELAQTYGHVKIVRLRSLSPVMSQH